MDFDVSVFIITSDRQYIPANEYDSDDGGIFLMLTNDELNTEFGDDNSICIYKDWFEAIHKTKNKLRNCIDFDKVKSHVSCPWQFDWNPIPGTFKLNEETDDIGEFGTLHRDRIVRKYLDGYRTNQEIMKITAAYLRRDEKMSETMTIERYLPAIMVAYHTEVCFDDRTCHGYLPSIGQLKYIEMNINTI